ncbi:MAG: PadR family transcriptional regulator [Solirubrobacterales bacterium]|nr:PadR family transcriptional regulator [Solirubrobacterales bacterium]
MGASTARNRGVKAMSSQFNWALLGLVISRPSYGFELARRFERDYGDVLNLSGDSHVYAALDRLLNLELIEEVPQPGLGRQPKLRYRATELGLRSYVDWLVEQVDEERRLKELWVRQLAVFTTEPATAVELIDRFQQKYLKRAGEMGRAKGATATSRSDLIDRLVAEEHRISVGGMLSWLGTAHETFEALASGAHAHEPPGT